MTFADFIDFLLCLILAGALGIVSQRILGFKIGGLFVSILIGFVGALAGRAVYGWFHLPEWIQISVNGRPFPVIWCFVGALVATLMFGYIARKGVKRDKGK